MTEYFIVGVGGALGSITRYVLGKKISCLSLCKIPIGTFCINISGALLLGIVMSVDLPDKLNLLFAEGFLGAYTTFSTFMYEGFSLIKKNEKLNALIYVFGSIVLGLAGIIAGVRIVRLF